MELVQTEEVFTKAEKEKQGNYAGLICEMVYCTYQFLIIQKA
jgi:hypothetical protein